MSGISDKGMGVLFVNSMHIETGTEWDIRQGKRGFVMSTAYKMKLEMSGISERVKGVCVVNSMQIEPGNEWDIR
jgi:hypothetical protein